MQTEELILESNLIKADTPILREIELYNDDFNTFDHVIKTLVGVCKHTAEQAEQCAMLVHYKGKCTVKTGSIAELKPQCLQLLDAGLSAKIV